MGYAAYVVTVKKGFLPRIGKVLTGQDLGDWRGWAETPGVRGTKVAELCPVCYSKKRTLGLTGHGGECGSRAVRTEAMAAIELNKAAVFRCGDDTCTEKHSGY